MDMDGHVWTWMDMDGHGRPCMVMDEHGWTCMDMDVHVRVPMPIVCRGGSRPTIGNGDDGRGPKDLTLKKSKHTAAKERSLDTEPASRKHQKGKRV